jgi:hypothetical protein
MVRVLIETLDDERDEHATEVWAYEIERRIREVRIGSVPLEDWEIVRARIRVRSR